MHKPGRTPCLDRVLFRELSSGSLRIRAWNRPLDDGLRTPTAIGNVSHSRYLHHQQVAIRHSGISFSPGILVVPISQIIEADISTQLCRKTTQHPRFLSPFRRFLKLRKQQFSKKKPSTSTTTRWRGSVPKIEVKCKFHISSL